MFQEHPQPSHVQPGLPDGAEREQGPWLSTYRVPGVKVITTIITIISTCWARHCAGSLTWMISFHPQE